MRGCFGEASGGGGAEASEEVIRIISARKADPVERDQYNRRLKL